MIGRGLRIFREGRDMKSKEFAKILGITAGHYSDIESGKRTLTPDGLGKLGMAMGLEPPALRQMLLDLAASAEEAQTALDHALGKSSAITADESSQLREDIPLYRSPSPMISNLPDTAGLARDLVAMLPREDVFKLLHEFTVAGEAGDVHAMRKARALIDLIPMPAPVHEG